MHFSIRIFVIICLFFNSSYTLDCANQEVDLNVTSKPFSIQSDPNDLARKDCKYTFAVPRNFVPRVVAHVKLTGENKITMRQYSEFGGSKVYNFTEFATYDLAPVNFTIEIHLEEKTADDNFLISITVQDATPADTGKTFVVEQSVGTLIDSLSIPGNSSLLQVFDNNHPQATIYTMKIVVFTEIDILKLSLSKMHVYDGGVYKGSLYDVYNAQQKPCTGSQFAIINTLSSSAGIFTVLVSEKYEWNEGQVFVTPAPNNATDQLFTATSGATVFHEITNEVSASASPAMYQQITFRGDGELKVYAGCVTGSDESKRIATITPANAGSWDHLMIYGRCKTFVLSKGVVQWKFSNIFPSSFRHQIGQKGVIMSNTYPYPSTSDSNVRNYLIQSPDANSKENIIVTYEVAHIAAGLTLTVQQDTKAFENSNKTLTSSDTTYTSVSTYQQYLLFNVPKGSEGLLVRYTVTSSTSSIGTLLVFCFIALFKLC